MTKLNEAVILITGAGGGFGQELTRQLLQAGSRLILADLDKTILDQVSEGIKKEIGTGEIIATFGVDLAQENGSGTLYNQVKALDIPIDILINNAGIGVFGRMDEVPSTKWEQLMQLNLLAPMRLSYLFVPDMIACQKGHVVNISSLAGWLAAGGMTHYAASKFGLRGFSEGLAKELKPYNVKVTAVYPFFSRTPILKSPQYGTLAKDNGGFPERFATAPAMVMGRTIQAILRDKPSVFPDAAAKGLYILGRYFPQLLNWILYNFSK